MHKMNLKAEILNDIRSTLGLVSKYSGDQDFTALISSIVTGAGERNIVDLFVIREFIKDKASAILAQEVESKSASEEDVDLEGLDSEDIEGDPDLTDLDLEKGLDDTEEPEVEESFEARRDKALEKANGYLQAIDLGINSVQNGDIDISVISQFIDLKTVIKNAIDQLAAITPEDIADPEQLKNNEKILTILNAVVDSLESTNDNSISLENIIKEISEGTLEGTDNITAIVDRITEIVNNPDELLAEKMLEEEPVEDTSTESKSEEDETPDEPKVTAADELVEEVEEKEGSKEEDNEDSAVTASTVESADDLFAFTTSELKMTKKSKPLLGEDTSPMVDEIEDIDFDSDLDSRKEEEFDDRDFSEPDDFSDSLDKIDDDLGEDIEALEDDEEANVSEESERDFEEEDDSALVSHTIPEVEDDPVEDFGTVEGFDTDPEAAEDIDSDNAEFDDRDFSYSEDIIAESYADEPVEDERWASDSPVAEVEEYDFGEPETPEYQKDFMEVLETEPGEEIDPAELEEFESDIETLAVPEDPFIEGYSPEVDNAPVKSDDFGADPEDLSTIEDQSVEYVESDDDADAEADLEEMSALMSGDGSLASNFEVPDEEFVTKDLEAENLEAEDLEGIVEDVSSTERPVSLSARKNRNKKKFYRFNKKR